MSGYLASWHERRGGQMAVVPIADEVEGPRREWLASYPDTSVDGFDPARQLALVDRSWTGRLELVGEDRCRFLNGLVTCDTSEQSLTPGSVRYGYFTDGRGRVMADVLVLALADRIWLELPAGRQKLVREHLTKYIVADRVDVRPLSDFVTVALLGEQASARLADVYGLGAADLATAGTIRLGRTDLFAHPHPHLGVPAVQLWVSSGIAEPLVEDLTSDLEPLTPLGNLDADVLRVRAGVPFWGVDFDDSNLPGEVAVQDSVDFEKGCYLGQEVVARMHYRGRPARELRRVSGAGGAPAAGADLFLVADGETAGDRRRVGQITSAVSAGGGASWSGLAMLSKAALDTDAVELDDESGVRIIGPPLSAD